MNVVLVGCGKRKQKVPAKAKDMYIGPLTSRTIKYGQSLPHDKLFILSAKYGLLKEDEVIAPYDLTLNNMNDKEVLRWAIMVTKQLEEVCDVKNDFFYILCGNQYYKFLIDRVLKNYKILMRGMTQGQRIAYLSGKGF